MPKREKSLGRRLFLSAVAAGGCSFFFGGGVQKGRALTADQSAVKEETGGSPFKAALPLLRRSCFPCHVPEAGILPSDPQLKKKALKEFKDAQDDFQMGPEFPFPNGRPPRKQLGKLKKQLGDKRMPPGSWAKRGIAEPISDAQRKELLNWIESEEKNRKIKR